MAGKYKALCKVNKNPSRLDGKREKMSKPEVACKLGEIITEDRARELFGKSDEDFKRALDRGLLVQLPEVATKSNSEEPKAKKAEKGAKGKA